MQGSAAEYARQRGISRQAVSKMISTGKIPVERRDGATVIIDFAVADRARGDSRARVDIADLTRDDGPAPAPAAAPAAKGQPSGLTQAATAEKAYRARLLKLELDEREGRLVPKDAALLAATEAARAIGRDLDALAQWADEITSAAAARGVTGVREILRTRARELRAAMARHLEKVGTGWSDDEDSPHAGA